MVEEFGSFEEGAGISTTAEWAEGPSQAEVSRVEAQSRKAKKIAWAKAQSKKQNAMIAQFLQLLLTQIQEDKLLLQFHRVFFRTKDQHGQTRIRKNTNNMVMIGLFVPFFQEQAIKMGLDRYFRNIIHFGSYPTIKEYTIFLKRLSFHHHDNIPLNKKDLLILILHIIDYFHLISMHTLSTEQKQEYTQKLYTELFEQNTPPPPLQQKSPVHLGNNKSQGKHGHHHNQLPQAKNAA